MAPHLLVLSLIILANTQVGLALAHSSSETFSNPLAPSPSKLAEPSMAMNNIRKQAKHQSELETTTTTTKSSGSASSSQTPLQATTEHSADIHVQNVDLDHKKHHSVDKSVAGGGVILGGLATTFLVAVFCYIRATGRHKNEFSSTTSSIAGSPSNV
ncbi:hypothetical protein TIFTF001_036584 [Ficus carica]|uniref:Uncharacterized protein n=1 Tax=Ficus carica TaxID=3494 RepID=A0AA88E4K3_FICCA|nr:hypothetical protein TIFTF001_036584 [Ficus carica]